MPRHWLSVASFDALGRQHAIGDLSDRKRFLSRPEQRQSLTE